MASSSRTCSDVRPVARREVACGVCEDLQTRLSLAACHQTKGEPHADRQLTVFAAWEQIVDAISRRRLHHLDGAAMIRSNDENKAGDRVRVVIVALVILAALYLAALILFSNNEASFAP
jgi:hypothetical protein